MKTKILIHQFIPSLFGLAGLYMLFSYLKNGDYKIANWETPYLYIIVFGLLFWLNTSAKIEDIAKVDKINIKKTDRFWLIFRILFLCIFSGISIYCLTRFLQDNNYMFTKRSIIEGILAGGFIFWLEYKSLSILIDRKI